MADKNKMEDDFAVDAAEDMPAEGMTFAVQGGARVLVEDGSQPSLPDRPAKSADRAKWVDYAVSLGADREFLENDTVHVRDATPGAEVVDEEPAFTVPEIMDLVEGLGG